METLECIRDRAAVRAFTDEPVPEPVIAKVLEAGRWAPSSKNSQPWHFIVVRDKATLRDLAGMTPTGPFLEGAPLAIAIAMIGAKMPHADAARAIQNMVLAAWDAGLGTCWIGNFNGEAVKKLLHLPGDAVFITAMPFGYPAPGALRGKRRKPLREIVHWEQFGQTEPPDLRS